MNAKVITHPRHVEPVSPVAVPPLSTVEVACPLCGEAGGSEWGRENGFTAVKCAACGLVYVSRRPDDAHISEATKVGQHRSETESLNFVYKRSARKIRRYRKMVRKALGAAHPRQPVSWLDIGAGFGELIEALQEVLLSGSEIFGVEPMGPKADAARQRGIPITSDPLASITRQFDFVSLVNVLSHLPDPREFLGEIARLVKPGGYMLLVTGNGGDLDSSRDYPDRLDLPDHLLFAGRGHVAQFLAESGFELVHANARRIDTPLWAAKLLVKRMLGKPVPLIMPLRSPFRDMQYLARRAA